MKSSDRSRLLLDCSFLSLPEYRKWLEDAIQGSALHHIVTLNAEMVLEAQKNSAFQNAVLRAELKIPDGSSIVWAKEYLDHFSPPHMRGSERGFRPAYVAVSLFKFFFSKQQTLTGVDTIFDICNVLAKTQGTVYLLGGEEADRAKTSEVLRKKYPNLRITLLSDNEAIETLKARNSALLVAYGSPKQTLWIEQHRDALESAGICIAVGIGGAFAMISGRLPRAPKFFRAHHLEWLWRLLLEPTRIQRIWSAAVLFPRFISGYPH